MLKALLKKQLLELNSFYFQDRKTGKRRSTRGIILYVVLFIFIFVSIASIFIGMADMFGDALIGSGMEWLYFALMGVMAILLGTFGSAFNTYVGLFRAKDNEMLLAMPIPPMYILAVRMVGVYLMSLLYGSLVWVPTIFQYALKKSGGIGVILMPLLLTFVLALLITVLTCFLGWVVAMISGKMKHKNIATVMISVVCFGIYYYVCMRMNSLLQLVLLNSGVIGDKMKKWIYPVYQLGRGSSGALDGFLIFTGITVVLFAVTCYLMAKSFLSIAMAKPAEKKETYQEKDVKQANVGKALFQKELRRFLGSPTYMLNTGLGIIILPVIAVLGVIKKETVMAALLMVQQNMPALYQLVPIALAAAICMTISMNAISAPSISLEGKSLWISQSMPVPASAVLQAKEQLHIRLNIVPAVFTTIVLTMVTEIGNIMEVLITAFVVIYVIFSARFGLILGLKKPNFTWTNEAVPIKQSMPVFVVLFGGWIISGAMVVIYYLIYEHVAPEVYLGICTAVFGAVSVYMEKWLQTRGAEIFQRL